MNIPPPKWDLPLISLPHTGGPLAYPTREECGICRQFAAAIQVTEHVAKYREAWAEHVTVIPHKGGAVHVTWMPASDTPGAVGCGTMDLTQDPPMDGRCGDARAQHQ